MATWGLVLLTGTASMAVAGEESAAHDPPDLGPPARLMTEAPAWQSTLPVEDYPFHAHTLTALEEVTRRELPVRVRAFFRPAEPGWREPGLMERVRVAMGRLLEAARFRAPTLVVEQHDSRGPLAQDLVVRQNGVFVVEVAGRRVDLLASDLEYLYALPRRPGIPEGALERVALFRGEEALASALRELLDGKPSSVCFTEGHGEGDLGSEDPDGFRQVADLLQRSGHQVERWDPARHRPAPARCGVVAMIGPRQELGEPTQEWLVHHLEAKRPFVLLLDAGAPAAGLGSALVRYGIELTDNLLVEPNPAFRSPSDPQVTLPDLNGHFITTPLMGRRQLVGLRRVRGIRYGDLAQRSADVRTILQSSAKAWGETRADKGPGRHQEDLWPPVSAAVAVSSRLGANDALELKQPGELRLAVVGDTTFVTNDGLARAEGNLDFFLRLVTWVSREPPRVSVPPLPVQQILR